VPPFGNADAAFAAGPPFLAIAEPSLLLFAFAFDALGGWLGMQTRFGGRLFFGK
jgi:hypothetical protein